MNSKIASALLALLIVTAGVPVGVSAGASAGVTASTAQEDCSFPAEHTDETQTEVSVEERPERVTVLGPSAAQTMWELGGESQVVGAPIDPYTAYLDGIEDKQNVSAPGRTYVNVEKVVATEPDLVLAPNVIPNETVEQLRDSGLTVFKFGEATSIEDIYEKTELTGQLTGNCEEADETVSSMQDQVETVQETIEGEDSPRVFVSQGGGWTAGNATFVNHLVELAGGTNIAVEADISGYQQISEEVIVEQNPEWIVQLGAFGTYPQTDAYNGTDAVQDGNVVTVDNNYASQPGPRVVEPMVTMAQAFYPDAYAEANGTATTTETTTEAPTTDTPETTTTAETTEDAMADATTAETESPDESPSGDSSGGVPGFGVPAALAALAGAALLARRN
ncbi:PGF-CTERM-anchored ABC transporter substrate-binding protein [Halorussus amylolyticus]|uniref:PGF-CTERM-anchored ABC transporter substrate-binding protein n=1 Tax=Halorussus amylolyticus TaxID=1126242 RepID=UPI001EE47A52|nr:PGF-CTERM-anchored ABC transporter substrate-binding protein [Halorussus amylolyticus]